MKRMLFTLFLFPSLFSFGQCTDCSSYKKAIKKPEIVTSLILNSAYDDKITLTEFPDSIRAMKNLKILYLTDHELTDIPAFIGELKKLDELSFAGNKLTILPEEIFTLTNLKELILLSNPFSKEYTSYIKKQCREKMPGTKLLID
jgi:Leucine-rich repeat (LRR) protein